MLGNSPSMRLMLLLYWARVTLDAGAPHCRSTTAIQAAEVHTGLIGGATADATHRQHLKYQVPLANAAPRRVA